MLSSLEEVGWLSENVPGLSLYVTVPLYLLCVSCAHSRLFLTSVAFLYTWLTLREGWGFFAVFAINRNFHNHSELFFFFNFVSEQSYS